MEIIHALQIETTPEKLYDALATDTGIAAWWTEAKIQPTIGSVAEFAFGDGTITFRVDTLEPRKTVGWTADRVPPDWKGTKVRFDFHRDAKRGPVTLRFSHTGFKSATAMAEFTSYAWAQYLRSLKLYLETGTGEPYGSSASIAAGTTPR